MSNYKYFSLFGLIGIKINGDYKLDYFSSFISTEKIFDKSKYKIKMDYFNENPQNITYVSNYMAYENSTKKIFLIDKNQKISDSIFGSLNSENINMHFQPGFSSNDIESYIIKPFLRKVLVKEGMAFIHASSFSNIRNNNKDSILISAWAHTGKTNTLIANLLKGAIYYGDDLSVICRDGSILPFPVPINLFYYNLQAFPGIRKSIPVTQNIKFKLTSFISSIFEFLNKISKNEKMKYLFYAGKTFFDSASHVPFKNYGSLNNTEKLNCRKLVLLERFSSKIGINKGISSELFSKRMQLCINYEFQRFNELSTSALWIPFYDGSDLFDENYEYDIYYSFCQNIPPTNVLIPRGYNTSNFDKIMNLIFSCD